MSMIISFRNKDKIVLLELSKKKKKKSSKKKPENIKITRKKFFLIETCWLVRQLRISNNLLLFLIN